jgi:hypothetical protein
VSAQSIHRKEAALHERGVGNDVKLHFSLSSSNTRGLTKQAASHFLHRSSVGSIGKRVNVAIVRWVVIELRSGVEVVEEEIASTIEARGLYIDENR